MDGYKTKQPNYCMTVIIDKIRYNVGHELLWETVPQILITYLMVYFQIRTNIK